MEPEKPATTVFFDGSCPLCEAEVGYYRREDQARSLCFVDVSDASTALPEGISREQALKRFHVRTKDGRVISGAAAFVNVWSCLPRWRWAARAASLPGALTILEWCYRSFLLVRPLTSGFLARAMRLLTSIRRVRIR
jgi:predicted DCC family thiol-disulfide oxidoreductase YuxK